MKCSCAVKIYHLYLYFVYKYYNLYICIIDHKDI